MNKIKIIKSNSTLKHLETQFNNLSNKEINYLLNDLYEDILRWYNGDLTQDIRKDFTKAILFLTKLFPKKKYNLQSVYRIFENNKEFIRKTRLSKITKPCASFSKDIDGLFNFIDGGGIDSLDSSYIVKINIKESNILIDTETLVEYLSQLITFLRTTKNTKFKNFLKINNYTRDTTYYDLKRTKSRIIEFKHENEIILKTDKHLHITKFIDSDKIKDIIKNYLNNH